MLTNETISKICHELSDGDRFGCLETIRIECPFVPITYDSRSYNELKKTQIFLRDGFIDRYSGKKLVFPGTMKIISNEFPSEFPYHGHGKMDRCHIAWWELMPTIDHIVPIARGGKDEEFNWVTTSMLKNSIKSNWTLDEMEWMIHPPGDINEWDGNIRWFLEYVDEHRTVMEDNYVKKWYNAAIKCLK